jgi:pore assembly and biogenesis protein Apq12
MEYLQGLYSTSCYWVHVFFSLLQAELTSIISTEQVLLLFNDQFFQRLTSIPLSTHLLHIRSTYLDPYIVEPLTSLLASSSSDLVSVLLLALILLISLKVLDYARRVIVFWVFLFFRLLFWGSLIGGGLYIYSVGLERAVMEFGLLWGMIQGFIEDFQKSGSRGYTQAGKY